MADVFISYAHTTARQARAAAAALRAAGYGVWLDDDLAVHRAFTQAIEEQLTAAKAALVIWSADAARSEWVLSEANRAREEHKLVQLVIDQTRLPMPFDQVQCADFKGWTGEGEHPNWPRVLASIAELVGESAAPARASVPSTQATTAAEPLLAVLAFDNLSDDPEMAYFSDGVSEEIQQTVARGSHLQVVGRTSSFRYRGAEKAVRKVAAELSATHVLDGAVRRSGARVRISAQLIECARETTLWSDRFDRQLDDVFSLQDEIAAAVASALKVVFALPTVTSGAVEPAAYEAYLKARELLGGSFTDPKAMRAAVGLLEQATTLAPKFARGWGALSHARAYLLRYHRSGERNAVTRAEAVEAAEKALALDPRSPLAFVSRADLEPLGRYAAREAMLEEALANSPNDPDAIKASAIFCCHVGRLDQALALAKRAYELDPLNIEGANGYALVTGWLGQLPECLALYERFLQIWPDAPVLYVNCSGAAAARRDVARVEALAKRAEARGIRDPVIGFWRDVARGMATPEDDHVELYLRHCRNQLERYGAIIEFDYAILGLRGRLDDAFDLMARGAFDYVWDAEKPHRGNFSMGTMFSPVFAARLMGDARFPQLCARLGLIDYWTSSDRWPDCARDGVLPYAFKAECRRLANLA